MPHRFAPPEPEMPLSPSRAQWRRYRTALYAWCAGNALRQYAEAKRSFSRSHFPDELRYLSSPAFDGGTARRLAENGTPASMDDVCSYIDRQQQVVRPLALIWQQLEQDLPRQTRCAWKHHVHLWRFQEIARDEGCSERTIIRDVGLINLYLMAALREHAGTKTGRVDAQKIYEQAHMLEAAWQQMPPEEELTTEEYARVGVLAEELKQVSGSTYR